MGIEKTVLRRLMPRRTVRRFEEDWPPPEDGRQAAPTESAPKGAQRPGWQDFPARIRAVIQGGWQRGQSGAGRRKTARSKADQANLTVMLLMTIDILLGAAIGCMGFFVLGNDGIALIGAVLATGGIILMLFFQLLGKER